MKRKDPIAGGFKVLVVPLSDISSDHLAIPPVSYSVREREDIRVVGQAEAGNVSCCSWAFTKATRGTTIQNLRRLADWLEKCEIED